MSELVEEPRMTLVEELRWHVGMSQRDDLIGLFATRSFKRGEDKTVLWGREASGAEIAAALRELADYVGEDRT